MPAMTESIGFVVQGPPITNSEVLPSLAACAVPCCCGHLWFVHNLICFNVRLHMGIWLMSLPAGRHACMQGVKACCRG